jgi:hypothetical protein
MAFCVTHGPSWSQQRSIGENAREVSEGRVSRFATGDSPLVSIEAEREGKVEILSLSEIRAAQLLKAQEVLRAVDGMHKEVAVLASKSRRRAIAAHNAKTHVRAHIFDVGDFVLSAVLSRNGKSKLSLQWHGPHRVTKCLSHYVFEVQDLRTGGTCEVQVLSQQESRGRQRTTRTFGVPTRRIVCG